MKSIAIDGPSGAGKSTLARALARELGFLYVDTGALYRAVGLAVSRAGANPRDEAAVAGLLPRVDVRLRHENGVQRVLLDGADVSEEIRTEAAGMVTSEVSAHPAVRAFLLETQRALARGHDVIMDGRDIGTEVLPGADLKIFLTASAEDRARRRHEELAAKGRRADYATVLGDVKRRDANDSRRAAAPLKQAADAVRVDTTGNTFAQSLEVLLALVRQRLCAGEAENG